MCSLTSSVVQERAERLDGKWHMGFVYVHQTFFKKKVSICGNEIYQIIQHFHKYTKLAMMALMPTLYSHIFAVFFIIFTK